MTRPSFFLLVLIAMSALTACAHARQANRFLIGRLPEYVLPGATEARESSSDFAARVRGLQAEAASTRARSLAPTIEGTDAALGLALRALSASPSPAAHRDVAAEYLRLGITDQAAEHFSAAVALDRRDAASYEQRARLWRDWGFPEAGLGDAYRAAYYAPLSAASQNTLGTLLHRLGHPREARTRYERALALDATAAYALNNLCAVGLEEGDAPRALAACREALSLDPGLAAAMRNLEAARDLAAEQGRSHDRD